MIVSMPSGSEASGHDLYSWETSFRMTLAVFVVLVWVGMSDMLLEEVDGLFEKV